MHVAAPHLPGDESPRGGSGESADAVEPEPADAARVFGGGLPTARRYVDLLADAGMQRGLIGPRELGRLWSRHILNCTWISSAIGEGARVVDIGSGAGLPGIPLAIARPDLRVDLVESLHRRATFLREAVDELSLADRVRVVHSRAEDAVGLVGEADVVTARAVAPLGKLATWAGPLLREGGRFVAMKGASAQEELDRDRAICARAGIEDLSVEGAGVEGDEQTWLILGSRVRRPGRSGVGGRPGSGRAGRRRR